MCFLVPLEVAKIEKNEATMTNGIKAYYNSKKMGFIKPKDHVIVYGNVILRKVDKK
jgi:hydrogenase maturation factor